MRKIIAISLLALALGGCIDTTPTSDGMQRQQNEQLLMEATQQVGMPAIKNFRERKMLKDILELRDQQGLTTYTYLYSEMTGKLVFFGETIGYGIPYSTQFTNPEKLSREWVNGVGGAHLVDGVIPQADPNGLFSPQSAEGTWVLMKDPNGKDVKPVYLELRIVVSPFKLNIN